MLDAPAQGDLQSSPQTMSPQSPLPDKGKEVDRRPSATRLISKFGREPTRRATDDPQLLLSLADSNYLEVPSREIPERRHTVSSGNDGLAPPAGSSGTNRKITRKSSFNEAMGKLGRKISKTVLRSQSADTGISQTRSEPRKGFELRRPEDDAALLLQSIYRGGKVRQQLMREMQTTTPYENAVAYHMATNNYSPKALKDRPRNMFTNRPKNSELRRSEVKVYQDAVSVPAGTKAYLHSFQRTKDFAEEMANNGEEISLNEDKRTYKPNTRGVKYSPIPHDMRANCAWLLGLAHNNTTVILTTQLDDVTVVRESTRRTQPPEFHTPAHAFSALGREVLAMLQCGAFRVETGPRGKTHLIPTERASSITLEDLRTPASIDARTLKVLLQEKGFDVSAISDPPTEEQQANLATAIESLGELKAMLNSKSDQVAALRSIRESLERGMAPSAHASVLSKLINIMPDLSQEAMEAAIEIVERHLPAMPQSVTLTNMLDKLAEMWTQHYSNEAFSSKLFGLIQHRLDPDVLAKRAALEILPICESPENVIGLIERQFDQMREMDNLGKERMSNLLLVLANSLRFLSKRADATQVQTALFRLLTAHANILPQDDRAKFDSIVMDAAPDFAREIVGGTTAS
jgi:hypothetical protein